MKVNWCLSLEAFRDRTGSNLDEFVLKAGHNLISYKYDLSDRIYKTNDDFDESSPTIFYGPIQFVRQMMKNSSAYPGAFMFKDGLNTNEYMSKLPLDWWLNSDGYWTTLAILEQKGISFADKQAFIRPNSAYKLFTGFVITEENMKHELFRLRQIQKIQDNELIFVGPVQKINEEFRCFIVDGEVATYSLYRWDDNFYTSNDIFHDCLEFADMIAKNSIQLGSAYVVDIASTSQGPKIIEVNSTASSGLYSCNLDIFVEKMSKLAIKEFLDI